MSVGFKIQQNLVTQIYFMENKVSICSSWSNLWLPKSSTPPPINQLLLNGLGAPWPSRGSWTGLGRWGCCSTCWRPPMTSFTDRPSPAVMLCPCSWHTGRWQTLTSTTSRTVWRTKMSKFSSKLLQIDYKLECLRNRIISKIKIINYFVWLAG